MDEYYVIPLDFNETSWNLTEEPLHVKSSPEQLINLPGIELNCFKHRIYPVWTKPGISFTHVIHDIQYTKNKRRLYIKTCEEFNSLIGKMKAMVSEPTFKQPVTVDGKLCGFDFKKLEELIEDFVVELNSRFKENEVEFL